jgi:class 3 adenylate cyclase
VATCAACGHDNPEGFRFCGTCGAALSAPVAPREERKVVTVLFADLVGFTSRSERLDPEDVRAMLSGYHERVRDELERHGGTVEKFIGDAVMAVFGAPVAHEDDPERAVRAAFAVREAVTELGERQLEVRIGITTGEALVRLGARPELGEGMAAGDVVNTAARLQSAAPVGGVLVDARTHRATDRAIVYRPAAPVEAKGKAQPVPVWEAVEPLARLGVDVAQTARAPLIGRGREVELLRGALERARDERTAQLVTLIGVPGIGKSRLVYELLRAVDEDEELIFWRQGRCLPYGEGVSFWALAEMVKAQAGILETDGDDEAAAKLSAAVATLLPDPEEARRVERHLRPLAGLAADGRGGEQGEAFAAWRRFFEALGEAGPAVLVFEDLHWADDGLLDFVEELVDWARGVPLLVVCSARPELLARRPGWGGGTPNATTTSLSPLSDGETALLLAALLDRAVVPAELQTALLRRAGGNPLYAEEFVRIVAERGDAAAAADALPESLAGIIAARLDGLSSEDKALLQDAAVIGKVFWVGAAAALGGRDRREAERRLHELERRQLVRRERRASVAGETEYAFWHVLVRDVAYGQIPRAGRAQRHRLAAQWITSLSPERTEDRADLLAYHYRAALEFSQAAGLDAADLRPQACAALAAAGDRAFALKSFVPALRYFRDALALSPGDDPRRAHILLGIGRALRETDEQSTEELTEARELFLARGEADQAAEAETLLGELAWHLGEVGRTLSHVERAVELVAGRPESAEKAYVIANLSRYRMLAGQNAQAIAAGREALAMAEALGLEELRAHALNNIGSARVADGDLEGLRDLERSIELAEANGSTEAIRGYINLASMTGLLGDLRRCHELHRRGYELARLYGQARGLRFLRAELITDAYFLGDWDEAAGQADGFLAEVEAGSPYYMEGTVRNARGSIRLARGDLAGALADVDRAIEQGREIGEPQALLPALGVGAFVRADTEDDEEAARLLLELDLAAAASPAQFWFPEVFAYERVGRLEEVARRAAGAASRSRLAEAAQLYAAGRRSDAADVLAGAGSLADEAYARLCAAEVLAAEGRRPEAAAQLDLALAFYRRVGATRFLRRGERLLAASA